jgi:hypothetical protein
MKQKLRAIWARIRREWTLFWKNPAPPSSLIGKVNNPESYRPIPLELGFYLHADGKVYRRFRDGRGVIRMDDQAVKDLVHDEYNRMVQLYKKEQTIIGKLRNKLARRRSRVDAVRKS